MILNLDENDALDFPDLIKYNHLFGNLVAVGGDLSTKRLIKAYKLGIFPWFSTNDPIMWWSPLQRAVLYLDDFYCSKSLQKTIKRSTFDCKINSNFAAVIKQCAIAKRGQAKPETWITANIIKAYIKLHKMGYAHCVESYYKGQLAGGLYGISMGRVFCGESMFAHKTDASKVAMHYLVQHLKQRNFAFIDCQVLNQHTCSLGAKEIPRLEFLQALQQNYSTQNCL